MSGKLRDMRAEVEQLQRQQQADQRYHQEAMAAVIAERDTYKEKLRAALALLQEVRALKPPAKGTR